MTRPRLGLAASQHGERGRDAGAVNILAGTPGVLGLGHQPAGAFSMVQDRGALRVDSVLLIAAPHAEIADDFHAALPWRMPLIPQQHFLHGVGVGPQATENAWLELREKMDRLPPVRVVQMDVQIDSLPGVDVSDDAVFNRSAAEVARLAHPTDVRHIFLVVEEV